jgi:L-gulonolactone oxidase
MARARQTVRTWAGNEQCSPRQVHHPRSAADVADIVQRAATDGLTVKAIGAGHSFTPSAMTDGELVVLDEMDGVVAIDHARSEVRVQAGITLHRLNAVLADAGLAMPNLGDIDVQTVAGAVSTATHGTGRALGNLATTIVGLELVDGNGEVIRADRTENPDVYHAARVGVGAMGLLTEVTIACVPAFDLHVRETVEALPAILEDFDGFVDSADHAEFFFFPGSDRAQVKRNRRTDRLPTPPSKFAYWRDKYLFENVAFGLACRAGRRFPSAVPAITRAVIAQATEREFVDRSDLVFASPRRVRFVEMEYGVPIAAVPEALGRIDALVRSLHHPVMFPIEVRCSAADDIPLSTGYGRDSGWIAVHQYRGMEFEHYFRGVEAIMDDYGGRPHWGKLHFQTADTLRDRYPEWETAMRVRDRLDPVGTFRNAYLDRVLDPVR